MDSASQPREWEPASQWTQLKVLLRKNFLLKWRNPAQTVGEIIFPLYILFILLLFSSFIPSEYEPISAQRNPPVVEMPSLIGEVAPLLAYAPNDNNLVNRIMSHVSFSLGAPEGTIRGFESEKALVNEQQKQKDTINLIYIGITFNTTSKKWPDELRYTLTYDDELATIFSYLDDEGSTLSGEESTLLSNAIGPVQAAVNEAIIRTFTNYSALAPVNETALYPADYTNNTGAPPIPLGFRVQFQELPARARERLFTIFQFMWPYLLIQVFFVSFQAISKQLGVEKERKIRETLRVAGLKAMPFWASWLITEMIVIFFAALSTTVLLYATLQVRYGSFLLILLTNYLYALSMVTFGFLLSVFFRKSKTLFNVGVGLMLLNMMIYYLFALWLWNKQWFGRGLKRTSMLVAPVAYGHAVYNFAVYELKEEGLGLDNINDQATDPAVSTALYMLIIDSALHLLGAWYFENVVPGEYGIPRGPLFCCSPSYWSEDEDNSIIEMPVVTDDDGDHVVGIDVRAIRKEFKSGETDKTGGKDGEEAGMCGPKLMKVAVNDLSVQMYENQIFALLGHNGAGKTTTQSMLVGMLGVTSGDAYIAGYSVVRQMDKIRERLGFCPQFDVVYDELTALEHMLLYAGLKGIDTEFAEKRGRELLEELGLSSKMDEYVGTFSGGQKRRLSVGLALLGDSKVIFLDEPTTGMDPFNRRKVWSLLQKAKQTKTIVLTTHSMEEADLLGDRIAIMSHGVISALGDSAALKEEYGIGYHFHMSVTDDKDESGIEELIKEHIPGAHLLTNVGAELTYALPLQAVGDFPTMLEAMDEVKDDLGVVSYAVSMTTLEEVFLKLAKEEQEREQARAEAEAKGIELSSVGGSSNESDGSSEGSSA